MKRIINGKLYNTETAERVTDHGAGLGRGDPDNFDEALYRTKKGNWFLAGSGGSRTKYARPCGNMTGGGSAIILVSEDEAMAWLEGHKKTEAIEEYFPGRVEEG